MKSRKSKVKSKKRKKQKSQKKRSSFFHVILSVACEESSEAIFKIVLNEMKNLASAIKKMFTYIITNHINTALYIGVTNDLTRRIYEHKSGLSENSFTKKYRLYKLVWYQEFKTPLEAIAAEKKIKGWIRAKKIALIKESNPDFNEIKIL